MIVWRDVRSEDNLWAKKNFTMIIWEMSCLELFTFYTDARALFG